jgi:hypothetical protein
MIGSSSLFHVKKQTDFPQSAFMLGNVFILLLKEKLSLKPNRKGPL